VSKPKEIKKGWVEREAGSKKKWEKKIDPREKNAPSPQNKSRPPNHQENVGEKPVGAIIKGETSRKPQEGKRKYTLTEKEKSPNTVVSCR